MRKGWTVILFGLILVLVFPGVVACTATAPSEVLPLQIESANIYTIYGGMESVTVGADFKIKNPNNVAVTVDSVEATLFCGDKKVGAMQNPNDYYIPAGGQVTVPGVDVVLIGAMNGEMTMAGVSAANAMMNNLPYWKKMGGTLPVGATADVFNALNPASLSWSLPVVVAARYGTQSLETKSTISIK